MIAGDETAPVDGVEFGLEGVATESGVTLVDIAIVVDESVVVKGGSVGGKPPKSGILRLMSMVTRKEKSYQLQCESVELKKNSL